jgi:hypothetical protein
LSRLAGTRARTLAALVYPAAEAPPPHPHAELGLSMELDGDLLIGNDAAIFSSASFIAQRHSRHQDRYEKTARSYIAFVQLAVCRPWVS